MKCISPPELDDRQLLAYLDNEADRGTVSHLEQCEYCRGKARVLARLHDHLTSRFYRLACPSSLELGEYHLRMLPASQMLIVAQHVRQCPHCTRELAQMAEFLSDLGSVPAAGLPVQAKVLIARLLGGQGEASPLPAFALRGESKGPLTFEVDGTIIILDIQPTGRGTVNILGQLAAGDQEQWTGALAELNQDSQLQGSSTMDDLGAFHFEDISPGSKELRVTTQDKSLVVLSNFEVST